MGCNFFDFRFKQFLSRTKYIRQDCISCIDFILIIYAVRCCLMQESSTLFVLRFFLGTVLLVFGRMVISALFLILGAVVTWVIGQIQRFIVWIKIYWLNVHSYHYYEEPAQTCCYPCQYIDQKRRCWYAENSELIDTICIFIVILSAVLGLFWNLLSNFEPPWVLNWILRSGAIGILFAWMFWLLQTFSCVDTLIIGAVQRVFPSAGIPDEDNYGAEDWEEDWE